MRPVAVGLHTDRENFLTSPRSATHASMTQSMPASGPEERSELLQRSDGATSAFAADMSLPPTPTPPRRPQSAGIQGRAGGIRRPGARQMTAPNTARRQPATPRQGHSTDGLSTRSVDRPLSASGSIRSRKEMSVSQRACLCEDEKNGGIAKDGSEVVSALMFAVLQIFEHRTNSDLWTKLLQPLKGLVACEDIKVVVRSVGPPPQEALTPGPFDPNVRRRMKHVAYVEQWSPQRIDGEAALTQRICRIPSSDAERYHWDQYEVARSQMNTLRCLVAVPLFDADGNVLAVVKLINRRAPDGGPRLEFSQADLATLSAFSAIFACIIPHPFLGLPGAGLTRRPQARLTLSDSGISAFVSWQVPKELRGTLIHEIRFGEVDHEDEYAGCTPQDQWSILPCGLLDSDSKLDGHESSYEFPVPVLQADTAYAFCVRLRNMHVSLDWSEPSLKLPTFLAPPHSISHEAVQLFPLSESMVQLEWSPFDTCDPGLTLIEYRVVARTIMRSGLAPSEGPRQQTLQITESHRASSNDTTDEQVVAVFISDGTAARESATIANLQSNMTYNFAIEARYAYVGTRTFTRVLVSDQFCFPTIDITLPAPQPLAADMVTFKSHDMSTPIEGPTPVLLKWPYPLDLASQLVLQYRTASVAAETRGSDNTAFPRFHVSTWNTVRASDCLHAQLVRDDAASELRVLCDGSLEGNLAVQLRVVMMPHGASASPPSAWFHPQPPPPPEKVHTGLVCSDDESIAMQIAWETAPHSEAFFDSENEEASSRELGPVGYAVHHDFSRGNGPFAMRFQVRIRAVSAAGEPRGDWEELPPQPLPPKAKQAVCQMRPFLTNVPALEDKSIASCYQWLLHEQRWFLHPGASLEVQLRHGNVLFWSQWSSGGVVLIQVQPPCPGSGNALLLQDIRADSVRLTWSPFLPVETQLRALEYRILSLELPDGSDTRPDAGGRVVSWRALDTVVADDSTQLSGGGAAPLQYLVRSLLPSRRYMFAVECRYLGLPSALAASSLARLEAQEAVPCRGLQLIVLPDCFTAAVQLAHLAGSSMQRALHGFVLKFHWRFRIQPLTASVPAVLCYQLCCVPEDSEARDRVLLPPALMSERSRSDGIGSFIVDRTREVVSADAVLCAGALEAMLPAQSRLQFAVRLGDPSTGAWGAWSDNMSDVVDLTIASPVPGDEQKFSVAEQLWSLYGTDIVPQQALHAVELVTLVWSPFQAAPTTPLERHTQLEMEYHIAVWAVDPAAPSLEEVRSSLRSSAATAATPADARLVFQADMRQSQMDVLSDYQNCCQVPGDCLLPTKYHYFQVTARYIFPDGVAVPEPEHGRPTTAVLLSSDAYRPTLRRLPAPRIERFTSPHDESPSPCVVLLMPVQESRSLDAEPTIIESREGCVYAGRPDVEPTVVASSDWTSHLPDNVEVLPGDRPRVLLRGLQASQVCQFRLRRGATESEASSWTDSAVWRPAPLSGPQLLMQMRRGGSGRSSIQGLGVGLGVGRDNTLYARLAWPRHAPHPVAIKLVRYQVRYRNCGKNTEWHVLPTVDLPKPEVDTAECQVSELLHGGRYEFAIRLCNALGRWSEWSENTVPLRLVLPAPAPADTTDLRTTNSSPSVVRLNWRPFSVPCRTDKAGEPPLLLDGADETQGTVIAEYEVLISEADSDGSIISTISIIQREAIVFFDELLSDAELPWLEEEVTLEPHKSYSFEVRARFRTGSWGPPLTSSLLLPRLLPISVGSPLVDLLLPPSTLDRGLLEAVLHLECAVRGFHRGDMPSAQREQPGADRVPAKIAQYQLRSCLANEGEWAEWPPVDAGPVHNAVDRVVQIDVPVHAAAVPLATGGTYMFALRCADAHGRWTSWSTDTESVSIQAPSLVPSLDERKAGGSNLRVTAVGDQAALLEWTQFRPDWDGAGVQKGLDACLQRVAYRLRMTKRMANSMADWVSTPITELTSERRLAGALTYDVSDLDARFEYVFHLSARWVNVPLVLGAQAWTSEISSPVLPSRLKVLRAPEAPFAEVLASDTDGLYLQARWCPSVALRDSTGLPVAGARYQVRFVQVPRGAVHQPEELPGWNWQMQLPVLESSAAASAHEAICRVAGPTSGNTYVLSVRVGDAYQWSPWSRPSEPVLFGVQPPMPSPGDVLEIACEAGASDSMKLEWRPFRTAADLTCVEYKVMALEWPHEEMPKGNSVLARLKRNAAEQWQNGGAAQQAGSRKFRAVGYITKRCMPSNQLRSAGDHVEWRTEGLRPGMSYRFFVCARYVSLPMGAMVPLPSAAASAAESEAQAYMWPDELYEQLQADTVAWEACLSRLGLWSPIVNTAHLPQYTVQPVMPSAPATLRCLTQAGSAGPPPKAGASEVAGDNRGSLPHAVEDVARPMNNGQGGVHYESWYTT